MDVRTIPARLHGRYLVHGGPAERLLAGFHGYGENAERTIEQLRKIPGASEWTLVAVQALHRFYSSRSGGGDVVASWMTSQDRSLAIADNVDYVRSVVADFPAAERLVYLGFSQGVAMAYRAAAAIGNAAGVIALGGDVPPDVCANIPPVLLARGVRDEWYSDEKFKKDLSFLQGVTRVTTCIFDGGHEWTEEFRAAAGRFLRTMNTER